MVSVLGIRLVVLSKEIGTRSLIATKSHSTYRIHLGERRSSKRSSITARIIHPAVMLMLSISKNSMLLLLCDFDHLPYLGDLLVRKLFS